MNAQNNNQKIYGTLTTKTVELPPKDEADRKRMEEMTNSLGANGLGVRVIRAATDWGYVPAGSREPNHKASKTFQSGDLVKLFKTIADGDVRWSGTIDLDRTEYYGGLQKGMDKKDWAEMFHRGMPAIAKKQDGTIIHGALDAFYEQGMEHIAWSILEYGQNSYAALNTLTDGDHLTVYSRVTDGDVDWEGRLSFAPENPQNVVLDQRSGWSNEIMRETHHMSTKDWLLLSWQGRPFVMKPARPTLNLVK